LRKNRYMLFAHAPFMNECLFQEEYTYKFQNSENKTIYKCTTKMYPHTSVFMRA